MRSFSTKILVITIAIFISACYMEKESGWAKAGKENCISSCDMVYWKCMESYGDPMLRDCFAEKYICLDLCR